MTGVTLHGERVCSGGGCRLLRRKATEVGQRLSRSKNCLLVSRAWRMMLLMMCLGRSDRV